MNWLDFMAMLENSKQFSESTQDSYHVWLVQYTSQLKPLTESALVRIEAFWKESQDIRKCVEQELIDTITNELDTGCPEDTSLWDGVFVLAYCQSVACNIQIKQTISLSIF